MTPLRLTVDVQNYRLSVTPTRFLLQRPSTPATWDEPKTLVREDGGGPNRNAVSFKNPGDLVPAEDGYHTAHVHGIIRQSDLEGGKYQEGDQLWLCEGTGKYANNRQKQDEVRVVNLRTWQQVTVPLDRVLWVPMYRRPSQLDGASEGAQEPQLITLAGPARRRVTNKKNYILAIVQQVVRPHQVRVELQELTEWEIYLAPGCENLRHIPGGDAITQEVCRRIRTIQEHKLDATAAAAATAAVSSAASSSPVAPPAPAGTILPAHGWRTPPPPPSSMYWQQQQHDLHMAAPAALVTPPQSLDNSSSTGGDDDVEESEEEDSEFKRSRQDLNNRVKARLSSGPRRDRRPYQKCDYPPDQCPTPATLFIRPEHTSHLAAHYHVPDDQCPLGRGHKPHCVYRSAGARDRYRCLLGSLVLHHCCERGFPKTRARTGGGVVGGEARGTISSSSSLSSSRNNSRNKRPPPSVVPVPEKFTVQRASRGEIQVVELLAPTKKKKQQRQQHHDKDNDEDGQDEDEDEDREKSGRVWKEGKEEFVKLPCEMVPAAPDFARDLDALGEAYYGVGQRADLRGRMWVHGEDDVAAAAGVGGERVAFGEEESAAATTKTTAWGVSRSCPGGVVEGCLGGERAAGVYGGGGGYGGYNDEDEVGVFADRHMDVDEYEDED